MKAEIIEFKENYLQELVNVSRQSFSETFAPDNTEENLQTYLRNNLTKETLAVEVLNPDSEFYLSVISDKVGGYLKINVNSAQTELQEIEGLEIERIYVLKEYLGAGIGKSLFEKALERAKKLGKKYVWLGVWEHNERAVAFYKKNGFLIFGDHDFLFGNEKQKDLLMKLIVD